MPQLNLNRPFNFMIPFWGKTYRDYFVDLCLPSLLSPGNFPLLRAEDGHRFLIATTKADWAAIQKLPIVEAMRRHVSPVVLEIDPPVATPAGSFQAIMKQNDCQRLLVETAYAARTYACMLWPDIVLSDGYVAALQRWISEGYELVVCASLRHGQEEVLAELHARSFLSPNDKNSLTAQPLIIPPRILADISVRHLHPEVCVYNVEDARFPALAPYVFLRVPDDRGILLHTFDGQPILMDFAAINKHDTECLKQVIFEHIYMDRNFTASKIYVVQDSDEFGILSLTPVSVGNLPKSLGRQRTRFGAWFALLCRLPGAMLCHTQNSRRIRRDLFRLPIRWHRQEIDEIWRKCEADFDAFIERAVGEFYEPSEPIKTQLSFSFNPWRLPGYVFHLLYPLTHYLPYFRVIANAVMGDAAAMRQVNFGIRRRLAGAAKSHAQRL